MGERKYELAGQRELIAPESRELKWDVEARTAEISFSSDIEGDRGWYSEKLEHGADNVDLSRLNSTGALLLNHDTRQHVGSVVKAWLDGNKARAVVKFSRSPAGENAFNDVQDGISRGVSVGYSIDKYEEEERKGKIPLLRATRWTPLEISLVPIPFDTSVGTDRSLVTPDVDEKTNDRTLENPMPDPIVTPPTPVTPPAIEFDGAAEEKRLRALSATVERNLTISGIAATHGHVTGMRELCKKYIDNPELSERAFFADVLKVQEEAQRGTDPGNLNLTQKEVKEYSLIRAIRQLTGNGRVEKCLESECDAELRKRSMENDPRLNDGKRRLFLPSDVSLAGANKRTLNTTTFASAGALIGDDFQSGSFIELLRNRMALAGTGVRILTGLSGNLVIPRQTADANASWASESGTISDSDPTFGQITLSPKRLGALTKITNQMIAQDSIGVEALVRDSILSSIALKLDATALHGTGAGAEPMGVQNQTGISGVTFGGAATWADICEFIGDVAASNIPTDSGQFITSVAVRTRWASILKDAVAGAGYLWELGAETVAGYRAVATNQVTGNIVFFGRWSDLVIGSWAAPSIMIDEKSLMEQSIVRIYAELLADMNIRYAPAFCVSTDTGAA